MISFGKAVIVYWLGFFGAQTFGQAFSEHFRPAQLMKAAMDSTPMRWIWSSDSFPPFTLIQTQKVQVSKFPQRQEKRNYSWRKEIKPKLSGKKWE